VLYAIHYQIPLLGIPRLKRVCEEPLCVHPLHYRSRYHAGAPSCPS
jgi:hypothetical protein